MADATSSTPAMIATNLQWVRKGLVIAHVDLEIPGLGFKFLRCTWGRNADGSDWVSPQRRNWTGRDGKTNYSAIIEMSRPTYLRFQEAGIEAIRAYLLAGGEEMP